MFAIRSLVGPLPVGASLALPLSAYVVGVDEFPEFRVSQIARARVGTLVVTSTQIEAHFVGLDTTWQPLWDSVVGAGRRPVDTRAKAVFDVVRCGERIELGWTPVDRVMLAATTYAQREARSAHPLLRRRRE